MAGDLAPARPEDTEAEVELVVDALEAQDFAVATDHGVFNGMMEEVKTWAIEKGWWDDGRTFGDEMILIASELIEALEEFRDGNTEPWYSYKVEYNGQTFENLTVDHVKALTGKLPSDLGLIGKPEGVRAEFADVLVRFFHTCAFHGVPVFADWREKMDYNWSRTYRHGGKAL